MSLDESIVEDAALAWFGELGYAVGHGPQLAPGEPAAERDSFGEVVLVGRLREAIRRLNPAIPEEAREEALRKVLRVGTPSLTQTNRAFHRMLRDGVPAEYPRPDGSIAGDHVRLVDFGDVCANDWLVVNQFTVIEGQHNRRPDIVVFINGLPLGLIELKKAADEDATVWSAYAQLQTSKAEIASLLHYNAALVVIFTTIHKFMPEKGEPMPELSARQNIVVIADEAHRSQYGFGGKVNEKTGEMSYGFASNLRDALPNASFIGFTGTPIEKTDANTRAVFGDYISIYDIQRAVADKATVPIYYESRISKLSLNAAALPKLDAEFEEITEGEELTKKEKLKTKWAALEALVGDPKRVALIAADLVAHFEKRVEAMDGKAMIVCMSRRIAVDLYNALIALRPDWASAKDDDAEVEKGKACVVKVVMTGSADDGPNWQPQIRSKDKRRKLANRFKDSRDPFRIVIVRDMWLTGFDAPCLHTMYADKPMQSHGFMQAIARVNRVFRDKPGGLVVDYLGLADQLKKALATYTESGGQGNPTFDTAQAIAVMLEKHGIACSMMHGFKWDKWTTGKPADRLALIPAGQQHILEQEDGKKRWVQVVTELSRAFALCAASDEATEIRDGVCFFQAIQAALGKQSTSNKKTPEQIDAAIRQLVSKAITTEGQVIDVFTAAGLPKPDISILSDQFLAEIRGLKYKNVAAELLEKLLKDELKVRSRRNLVQSQVFSEKLKQTLNAYHNRAISTLQVLEELIQLAKDLDAATKRGQDLGLTEDEVAFYDALAANQSAVIAMGDDKLKVIAAELITKVRQSVTIDWTLRESARAKIRVMVRRILNKYGYPPDLQEEAVKTVLAQAELLCAEWV